MELKILIKIGVMKIFVQYLFNRIIGILRLRLVILVLVALFVAIFSTNYFFMQPALESELNKQQAIIASKMEARSQMSVNRLIAILTGFAKVDSKNLWIHSMSIDNKDIDLVIRSSDIKTIERYIYEVVDKNNLALQNLVIKNIKAKQDKSEEEGEEQVIPFAVQLYLKNKKNSGDEEVDSGDQNEKQNEQQIFIYEAKIKLFADGI